MLYYLLQHSLPEMHKHNEQHLLVYRNYTICGPVTSGRV